MTDSEALTEARVREVLFFTSYCGDDNPACSSARPCPDCLAMSNVFRIPMDTPATYVRELGASPALGTAPAVGVKHPDDEAVDRFAAAMKAKLAKKRDEGRGGWENKDECSAEFLSELLRGHVEKGDPLDVGNLAMMLHQRGERIAQPIAEVQTLQALLREAADWLRGMDPGDPPTETGWVYEDAAKVWKRLNDAADFLASSKGPLQMQQSREWLREKIATDPDIETEVRPPASPAPATAAEIRADKWENDFAEYEGVTAKELAETVARYGKALNEIASLTQTEKLLWWQIKAREALGLSLSEATGNG